MNAMLKGRAALQGSDQRDIADILATLVIGPGGASRWMGPDAISLQEYRFIEIAGAERGLRL